MMKLGEVVVHMRNTKVHQVSSKTDEKHPFLSIPQRIPEWRYICVNGKLSEILAHQLKHLKITKNNSYSYFSDKILSYPLITHYLHLLLICRRGHGLRRTLRILGRYPYLKFMIDRTFKHVSYFIYITNNSKL